MFPAVASRTLHAPRLTCETFPLGLEPELDRLATPRDGRKEGQVGSAGRG
jgi:hypothetical protein